MGKASSNKKVARAAKAGGSKARAAGERNLVFPAALAVVVILGTLLVAYARDDRLAEALEAPLLSDHWHSAYGIYACDEFLPALPEFVAPQNAGIHTHGDGLIHIHPFSSSRTGENAKLHSWFDDAAEILGNAGGLSNDSIAVPGGATFTEGDSTCEGVEGDPIVQVGIWNSAAGAPGTDPDRIVTENFDDIRFEQNGQAYTIAFVPEGAEIPAPETSAAVGSVSQDLGVPQDSIPADAEQPNADQPDAEDPADPASGEPSEGEPSDDPATVDQATDDPATDPATTEADADQ